MSDILTSETVTVWTTNAGAAIEHPVSDAMASAGIKTIRVSLEMRNSTGVIQTQVYYQYSADGDTWETAVLVGPLVTESGEPTFDSTFTDISADALPYLRFGVKASNASESGLNLAYVTYRIELRAS
jgi:hypothetical protein